MKVFLDVESERDDGIFRLKDTQTFTTLWDMLKYITNVYTNIVNLRQLDEEDKDKGDLYFEVYVKKVI